MKTKILSLVILAVFAFSTSVFAQNQEGEKNQEHRRMMMYRHKQMKKQHQSFFTEEQQETLKKMRLETAKKIKPIKNELNELNARQQTLTTVDKADINAINKNIDKMAKLKAEMQKIMAQQHQEIRAMLSEEQLLKFDAMKNRRENRGHYQKGKTMQKM